ncbi:hypothetical protein DMA11_23545 [Marinilabiliaceae bacterium JC017]|nr:hypothetical protein DMA11_23545 [Marinilabiliaceae bacterium JC017]
MKKLLVLICAVGLLASCNKDNEVKPTDQVMEIEKNMWQIEDGSKVEFVPEVRQMLAYGDAVPFNTEAAISTKAPLACTYYLYNNGSAKINQDQMKFTLKNGILTIGDNTFKKIRRENTNEKEPMKGAKNKDWSKVVNGHYSVELSIMPEVDITLSFIKNKALAIMRQNDDEPVQSSKFAFKNDKLYFDKANQSVGFSLESYSDDKIILHADDDTDGRMILYPLLY